MISHFIFRTETVREVGWSWMAGIIWDGKWSGLECSGREISQIFWKNFGSREMAFGNADLYHTSLANILSLLALYLHVVTFIWVIWATEASFKMVVLGYRIIFHIFGTGVKICGTTFRGSANFRKNFRKRWQGWIKPFVDLNNMNSIKNKHWQRKF